MNRSSSRSSSLSLPSHHSASVACLFFLFASVLAGCSHSSPDGLPVVSVVIGSRTYQLEVAATPAHREKGLMQRDSLPATAGMLFIFPDEDLRSFWMKNTRIPLDIIYLSAQGNIVSIATMKPYVLEGTPSIHPAQYAIELNAGQAALAGIKVGDRISLPPGLPMASE